MAIKKDFIVKNGLQVNSAASFGNTVSIAGNTSIGSTISFNPNSSSYPEQITANGGILVNANGASAFYGTTVNNFCIYGNSNNNYGVIGTTNNAVVGGVIGYSSNGSIFGILGHANQYGIFSQGPAYVSANLVVANTISGYAPTAAVTGQIGTNSKGNRTLTTSAPGANGAGGVAGDIWYQY